MIRAARKSFSILRRRWRRYSTFRAVRAKASQNNCDWDTPSLRATDSLFVIGNGPSLKETLSAHSKVIENTDSICVNFFAVSDFYSIIRPKYCVALDPNFGDPNVSNPVGIRNAVTALTQKTRWPLHVLLPDSIRNWNYFLDVPLSNHNVRINYFNSMTVKDLDEAEEFRLMKRNWLYPSACGMTVLLAAVFLGLNLGYRKLYLVGADHSWHEDLWLDQQTNQLYRRERHAYDKSSPQLKLLKGYDMERNFQGLYEIFSGYKKLSRYANQLGTTIVNASDYSWIDVFPREQL